MISHASPIIVLDDQRNELWSIAHGLGCCGIPVMPQLVQDGRLERPPQAPYTGIRLFFSDLHLLQGETKVEANTSALISFLRKLVAPTTYLIVFWSNYPEDAKRTWDYLTARLNAIAPELLPFGYEVLGKDDVRAASDDDPSVAQPAVERVQASLNELLGKHPQLSALMEWEGNVSRAASVTTNELVGALKAGGISFAEQDKVRRVLSRMAQEALGVPHAPQAPARGLTQAFFPIAQECLECDPNTDKQNAFLHIPNGETIALPDGHIEPLLNDFFVHTERSDLQHLQRGAVIRLSEDYLADPNGLSKDVGLTATPGNWKEVVCAEFAMNWHKKNPQDRTTIGNSVQVRNVFAIELSADCDHAQDKPRTQRFMFSIFAPSQPEAERKYFYSSSKGMGASDAIYVTPEITIDGVVGRLMISCRTFFARPHSQHLIGDVVSRLRKEVVDEISHQYSSHMRRPGKVAFLT